MRWLFEDKRALHGVAAARILSGCAVLGLLVSNIRPRDLLFGPGSVWAAPVQGGVGGAPHYWPTEIVARLGSTAFLFYYLAVIVLAVLWIAGWRTRLVGLLMLIGEVSIIERAPLVGDQGDNILRVGIVLLLFMQTSDHWSLDARRRARRGERQPVVPLWLSNGIHNVALAALAFQVVLVYFSAGMAKARGDLWQHGTALYYPLQLQEFRPFPFLNDLFTHVRTRRRHRDVRRHGRRARVRVRPAAPGVTPDRGRRCDRPARLDRGGDGVAVVLAVDARVRGHLRQREHLRRTRSLAASSGAWATRAR